MEYFLIPLSYLVGSFPTGLVIGYILKGIDVRMYGSGNIGATNVSRVLGKKWGICVLVIDALKGALCALMGRRFSPFLGIMCGVASIIGHNWSIYLRGKGGKGVATTAGVVAVLTPLAFLVSVCAFTFIVYLTRYISLGSLSSALFYVFMTALLYKEKSLFLFSILLCAMVFFKHTSNIKRLLQGKEYKFK